MRSSSPRACPSRCWSSSWSWRPAPCPRARPEMAQPGTTTVPTTRTRLPASRDPAGRAPWGRRRRPSARRRRARSQESSWVLNLLGDPEGAIGVPWSRVSNFDKERSMIASEFLPPQFNVATWFVDRNVEEGRGASPAFHCEGRTLTYADVQELANRTGNALLELGVGMEDRVLVLCLDTPAFLGAFWGAIKIGAVPIPTNTLLRTQDYAYFLNDSRAKVAIVSAPLLAEAGPALAQAPSLKHVLVAGGAPGPHLSFEDRVAKASSRLDAAPTSRDEPAFWLYSSGSTGFPKGAVHLHHDMVICTETFAKQVVRYQPTVTGYSAAKLFFAYGLGNAGYFPMAVGARSA